DAQALGGDGPEDGDRLAGGGRVEPAAAGDAGGEHGQQVQARGPHLQAAAVRRGDERAAIDPRVLQQAGVRDRFYVVQERDPPGRLDGQRDLLTRDALAGTDGEQVGA